MLRNKLFRDSACARICFTVLLVVSGKTRSAADLKGRQHSSVVTKLAIGNCRTN